MKITRKFAVHHKIAEQHINRKLRIRLMIYSAILVIMTWVSIYEILHFTLNIWYVIIGLILGLTLGLLAGRIFKIVRHPDSEQVISHMDKWWIAIMVIYIAVELNKKILFSHRLHGNQLEVFGWIFLAGIFAGRLWSLSQSITIILRHENKIDR